MSAEVIDFPKMIDRHEPDLVMGLPSYIDSMGRSILTCSGLANDRRLQHEIGQSHYGFNSDEPEFPRMAEGLTGLDDCELPESIHNLNDLWQQGVPFYVNTGDRPSIGTGMIGIFVQSSDEIVIGGVKQVRGVDLEHRINLDNSLAISRAVNGVQYNGRDGGIQGTGRAVGSRLSVTSVEDRRPRHILRQLLGQIGLVRPTEKV